MPITQSMVRSCIRREVASAIPEKKKRNLEQHQRPLFAWIIGAHKIGGKSPIECVRDNQTRWPWHTLSASGHEFVRRVSKKRNLTFVQKQWLYDYISNRYQGRYESRYYTVRDAHWGAKDPNGLITRSIYEFVDKCLQKEKLTEPPLKLILSDEFSCLIELKTLEKFL